ncbi:MAG: hypothetical protein KAG53_03400 [Endozoicomonadaceae bacterium]|nr:hypothetical protein [Endozoicomonadaceae bacterium]
MMSSINLPYQTDRTLSHAAKQYPTLSTDQSAHRQELLAEAGNSVFVSHVLRFDGNISLIAEIEASPT